MSSSTQTPELSPTILLFARGLIAILNLWPALTIAVREEWGGSDSREKRTWMASTIVDEFESRATYLPNPPSSSSSAPVVDPASATDPPLDFDDLADLILQIMSDEFEANIEDGSIDAVANDILRLWKHLLAPPTGTTPESIVETLEGTAQKAKKSGVQATAGAGPEVEIEGSDDDDDDAWEDDDAMAVDGEEPPQLVSREKEKEEPVVDEDGFTLVQPKGKGRK
jgi:pre-rRNA-processing protein TSR2